MAQSRFYSATAQPTVLTATITPSQTSIVVQQVVGFPVSVPYILAIDYNSPSEEIVLVTAQAGTSLTVTRAYDSTSAASHAAGAAVRHTWTALDGNDSRFHEGSSTAVHGITGSVVGTTDTQTLSNKTLASPVFTGTVSMNNPNITGTVTGLASYTSITATNPTISGTIAGSGTYTTPTINGGQWNDALVRNSAVGVIPLSVNSIASTTALLAQIANNGASRFSVTSGGQTTLTSGITTGVPLTVVAPSGTTVDITKIQKGSGTDVVKVDSGGILHALNGLDAGSSDQFNVDSTGNITAVGNVTSSAGNFSIGGNLTVTGIGTTLFVRRTSDLARTSTISRTDDTQLTLALVANATYQVEGFLIFDADTAGDFAMNFTSPAGATLNWTGLAQGVSATTTVGTVGTGDWAGTTAVAFGGIGAGTKLTIPLFGLLRTSAAVANLTLQWAQSTSSAVSTTLFTDSYLKLTRLA